jgi:hypothetical protein
MANEYTTEQVAEIMKMMQEAQKNDPASLTATAQTLHGPWHGAQTLFGPFSDPSVRPSRWSALQRPETFMSILPVQRSDVYNNELEIVTGQTAGGTTNAASFCGNPPEVGQLKRVKRRVRFGKYFVKTELNRIPVTGMRRSYGDVPGNIINAGPAGNPFIPDIMFNLADTRSELRSQLYRVGIDMERTMEVVAMRGTAATDNSRTGWFEEFGGLDGLITTGITDVDLAIPAPAADSAVVAFNADVEGNAGDGRNLAEVMSDTWYALRDRGERVGVNVAYAIVMRKEAFRRVVDTLACTLNIYQCAGTAAAPANRDAAAQQQLRIEMQSGRFLWIEGERVPVVFSEGILHEVLANNTYKSDMYFVPITGNGIPITYMEHFDMGNPYAMELTGFTGHHAQVLNNGMYFVTQRDSGNCIEFHFSAQFRLVLEAPFLAGRIDDLQYAYLAPTREAVPGTSLYTDGGVSYIS